MNQGNPGWIPNMQVMAPQMTYVINRPPYGTQQRQAPQSVAPAPMAQPVSTGEYTFAQMEAPMYQPVMSAPVNPAPQAAPTHQKTVPAKKKGSSAIQIINPNTGKSIFDDDTSSTSSSTAASTAPPTASTEKTASAGHVSDGGSKTEAVEEKTSVANLEPSTPVVSAMTDGPSVDITPKHQVHKTKKV